MNTIYDLIVIGGGPAGLSAAIEAKKRNLTVLVLDKGTIVNSIQNFPSNTIFFSNTDYLEIGDLPFESRPLHRLLMGIAPHRKLRSLLANHSRHPSRTEVVSYYARVANSYQVEFEGLSKVISVTRHTNGTGGFCVEVKNAATTKPNSIIAKWIVVATGCYDNPNLLHVRGEDLPNVSHYYRETSLHNGQKVVVIGGANSASEAALDLMKHGIRVTMLQRGRSFSKNINSWVLENIQKHVKDGSIVVRSICKIMEIRTDSVIAEIKGQMEKIDCDFVYAMTGYHPDVTFISSLGIEVDEESGAPRFNPLTLETNVPGMYVAGAITSGHDGGRSLIQDGRKHGRIIARSLGK